MHDDSIGNLFKVSETEYYSEPPVDPKIDFISDPATVDRLNHICKRQDREGKTGPAELLTLGLVRWCVTKGAFWCSTCKNELDFDGLWESWNPPGTTH